MMVDTSGEWLVGYCATSGKVWKEVSQSINTKPSRSPNQDQRTSSLGCQGCDGQWVSSVRAAQ